MPKTTTINVADAKRHFADLLGRVAYGGETITITRRGKPMAQLVPVGADTAAPHVADAQGWLEDDAPFLPRLLPSWQTGRPITHTPLRSEGH